MSSIIPARDHKHRVSTQNTYQRGLLLLTLLLPVAQITAEISPSFDCHKTRTKVERLICESPTLSRLDVMLDGAYRSALAASPTPGKLREEQRTWLKSRNYCKDVQCLEKDYRDRLEALYLTDGPDHAASRGALEGYGETRRTIPTVIDILRKADKLEPGSKVIKNAPICEALVEAVRNGGDFKVVPPDVDNVHFDDPRLQPYLRDCDKGRMRYGSTQVSRSIGGMRIMADSGRVNTPYDDYAVWELPACSGDCFMLYQGPDHINVERSLLDEGPYWGGGAAFRIFEPNGCKQQSAVNTPFFPRRGATPFLTRQNEMIMFKGASYLAVIGDLSKVGKKPYFIADVYAIKSNGHFNNLCKYKVDTGSDW